MDVLVMATPPPMLSETGTIRVAFTVTGQASQGRPGIQISFAVDYAYGSTLPQRRTAVLAAARDAYVMWCGERGIAPLDPAQMRVEVLGIQ
jgi:hypothetical protein